MKTRSKSRTVRLSEMAKTGTGKPAGPQQCRICLADETFSKDGASSLARGACRDRAACEQRQPALFGPEETNTCQK